MIFTPMTLFFRLTLSVWAIFFYLDHYLYTGMDFLSDWSIFNWIDWAFSSDWTIYRIGHFFSFLLGPLEWK